MICKDCQYAADEPALPKKQRKWWHGQCKGCDCHHKPKGYLLKEKNEAAPRGSTASG